MAKPVILTVDDEPQVLNAVERDLRKVFSSNYRIVKADSGAEALEVVRRLKQRNTPLALFLVDQRMPEMTGIEFLGQAIKLYPDARKVLLTAYADTEAAIASINKIDLDYYLMKPWDPPETNLYPVLEDLLNDWNANVSLPYEGIRVAGTLWSARSHQIKDFLARSQIPYQWLDVERDEQTRLLVEPLTGGGAMYPVVFFPDGETLIAPDIQQVAGKIGMSTRAAQPFYDLAIIGGGPAGLAAAVYGASEGLRTLMIEKEATGGQAGTSSHIENYLGFPRGLSGADLARRATAQAKKFGTEILTAQEVTGLRVEENYRFIRLSGGAEISCHAVLVATGVEVRRLEAPGVEKLTGAGIYYGAAITEASYYRNQDVFVIGGGNSAGQGAIFLATFAHQVNLLVRGPSLAATMSQYLIDQINATPNICLVPDSEVAEVIGEQRLEGVAVLNRKTQTTEKTPAAAMFIFIGAAPRTDLVEGLVQRDMAGYLVTGQDLYKDGKWPQTWPLKRDPFLLETSCPGIFAAGDVRHGSVKRIGSAVGEGAVSVALIHQYLSTV